MKSSLDKALRTLPQNQLGASSTASYARLGGQHFNGATNLSGASAINLRGLGNGATLVLVDGKRMGSSGLTGGVTDISGIPTSSIERVEIMLDGASAIYGSDAVGGVVNIITRKDYEGVELEVMHSVPDRGGFDESTLTLTGSWLWGETRMRRATCRPAATATSMAGTARANTIRTIIAKRVASGALATSTSTRERSTGRVSFHPA